MTTWPSTHSSIRTWWWWQGFPSKVVSDGVYPMFNDNPLTKQWKCVIHVRCSGWQCASTAVTQHWHWRTGKRLPVVIVSQVGGQNVNTSIDTRLLCTCVPHRRFAKKTQAVCLGKCPAALQTCTLERAFLHLLSQRLHVPVNIWKGLEARYPTFHAWLESRATLCAPSNMDTVEIPRKRKISDVAKSYILDSINQSYWTDTADWTPWAFFMIDTISSQGFLDGCPFFWTELWPSHYKISFCLDPFSVTCFPSNHRKQGCKTWFCIRPPQIKCLSFTSETP